MQEEIRETESKPQNERKWEHLRLLLPNRATAEGHLSRMRVPCVANAGSQAVRHGTGREGEREKTLAAVGAT
jgi:hypothetical protein